MAEVMLKPGERIDQLYGADIKIIQSANVFSFSLDAVLLADFAKPDRTRRGLTVDLCAGNGAVGLFFSHQTKGPIKLVELQPALADMAERSVSLNELTNQIDVLNMDLADAPTVIKQDSASVVTCNPPYFVDEPQSQKNPNDHYAIARHELTTNLEQVVAISAKLLKMTGHAYFVFRPDRFLEMMATLQKHRLMPKRVQFVYPKPGREANMFLVDAIKDGKPGGLKILPPLLVADDQGDYIGHVHDLLYGNQAAK
ncbi:tRNA1(Val) (adenine(37)-N6)-methyltransferase [Furfurilactobacillus siliginis]|uniref:Methyltransferase n=1 Tax=Furfurilactobacillus siliginis TaxID=348151 RepID=A0A0R2L0R5_9LACO|nr:tRNA1(Val) (adenine(37)-N6)-methyltransferase [Furfurilactobacillus siliginis]KRN95385.1 O-methyltransferase [Furfurilactobacillus siliginis]GEK28165.1 methyltransferase [Furfurilactobacillus siliginis]